MERLVDLLPLVFVLEHGRPRRGGRGSRQQVSRAMAGGASGPEDFTLLLRLLMTHFDGVDTEEGYTKLHTFGMCTSMPFSDFSREFRVLVPTATRSERVSSPGTDVVLEVVWVATNEQLPALIPALYPCSKATDPQPYASLDAIWRLLVTKRIIRNLPSTAKHFSLCLFLRRERGYPPRRDPGPPIMGAARAECRPSRFRGRRDRAIIQRSCPSMIHLTLGLTTHRTDGH